MQHEGWVGFGLSFGLDGRRVLTASWDHTARLWDANTGRQAVGQPMRHEAALKSGPI